MTGADPGEQSVDGSNAEGELIAICRDCGWQEDGSTPYVDSVEEEAEVHSIMLAHTVDVRTRRGVLRVE